MGNSVDPLLHRAAIRIINENSLKPGLDKDREPLWNRLTRRHLSADHHEDLTA